jgi:POT family proton-dependent oligopeptide transporter
MNRSLLPKFSKNFWLLFLVASILMFGFAFYLGTTVLYLSQHFHRQKNSGYEIMATFIAIVYFCSVISGYLTQRFFHSKLGLVIGFVLYGLGTIFSGLNSYALFILGLTIFSVGYGFIYTNTFYLLGKLYAVSDPRRESVFTLAYMGFNVGALLGFFLGGLAIENGQYSLIVSAMGCFFITMGIFLNISPIFCSINLFKISLKKMVAFFSLILILVLLLWLMLDNAEKIQWLLFAISSILLLGIFGVAYRERANKDVSRKLITLGVLTLTTVVYWAIYRMQDGLLLDFFQNHVNRWLLNHHIPAPVLLGIDPFVILLIGPLVSLFWVKFGVKINTPVNKVFLGLIIFSFSFLFLILGLHWVLPMPLVFVVPFLIFLSLSELIISPGTIAMVGQLAEEKYHIILLGVVQLSASLGSIFSGEISVFLNTHYLEAPSSSFHTGYLLIFVSLATALFLGSLITLIAGRLFKNGV